MGNGVKLVGKGARSNTVYEPILSGDQLALLTASPASEPFDGDASRFRLGIEAMRLGLAYEYDPYFSLSIARVDPLPTGWKRFTIILSSCRASASCSPTIRARAKPLWPGSSAEKTSVQHEVLSCAPLTLCSAHQCPLQAVPTAAFAFDTVKISSQIEIAQNTLTFWQACRKPQSE
jgi:hypothetical protein